MPTRLILSRKGFDSSPQGGGGPSPILPDGSLLSLPIPSRDSVKYSQLRHPKFGSYQQIIQQLGLKPGRNNCHLDPDLARSLLRREPGWRASLGQSGAAQSHLQSNGVSAGDLFLFFGWFRQTQVDANGRLIWSKTEKQDLHALFGYLEVGRVYHPKVDRIPDWLRGHPHCSGERVSSDLNAIYVAQSKSRLFEGLVGANTLGFRSDRVLTIPGKTRSWWVLPKSVFGQVEITYHKNAWKPEGFRCVGRGQEFVMPMTSKIKNWVKNRLQ